MAESSPKEQKTLWVKEKLLVKSNFSFTHSVFKRLILQTRKNQGLFGKGLIKNGSFTSTWVGYNWFIFSLANFGENPRYCYSLAVVCVIIVV